MSDKKKKIDNKKIEDLTKDLEDADYQEIEPARSSSRVEAELVEEEELDQNEIVDADTGEHMAHISDDEKKPDADDREKIIEEKKATTGEDEQQKSIEDEADLETETAGKFDQSQVAELEEKPGVDLIEAAPTEKEEEDFKDKFLRKAAEFENYLKRNRKEKDELRIQTILDVLSYFLPVLDNFTRAMSVEDTSNHHFVEGVKMIHQQMLDVFHQLGIEQIDAAGKPFDPDLHEAILTEETDEYPEDTVIKELAKGYLFRDRLLRPARVIVAVNLRAREEQQQPEEMKESEADTQNDIDDTNQGNTEEHKYAKGQEE